jgi:hypothetical protein
MPPVKIALALLAAVLLGGCSSLPGNKKDNALETTLSEYQSAMRWGYWSTLMGYRGDKAPPVPALDFDNIRITGYEVRQPPVSVRDDTVLQVAEIQYVLTDQQRVHKVFDKQEWRYSEKTGQWRLFSSFPELR